MLNSRQSELLKLIVEDYTKTAKAVSSKSLCEILKFSSATIRNEMSYLEEIGLLEKTHISSGRIPSQKGYRYYIDNIMKPKELTGEDVLKLQTIFHNKSLALNDTIIRSMEIISELTSYTSVVLGDSSNDNRISKVEIVPIDENHIIALVITDKGHVEHKRIYIEDNVSIEEIRKTVEIINKLIVNTPIDEVSVKLEFEIKPEIAKYIKQHEVIYNAFYKAFSDLTSEPIVRITGTSNILKQPEFDDNVDKIRDMVSKFDDPNIIRSIKVDSNGNNEVNEVQIYIGTESDFDDDVGLIKTKYEINGETGTIAIIGPKRMEYDRVLALLDYIKKNIGG